MQSKICLILLLAAAVAQGAGSPSWSADNGNGTYSNPLFYDEFSDPDMIRVGPDYYLTGTTMHTMPGLPISVASPCSCPWRRIATLLPRALPERWQRIIQDPRPIARMVPAFAGTLLGAEALIAE
jgi:hypothetical protein